MVRLGYSPKCWVRFPFTRLTRSAGGRAELRLFQSRNRSRGKLADRAEWHRLDSACDENPGSVFHRGFKVTAVCFMLASGRRGLPSVVVHGLLTAVASLPWLPCRGTRTSAVVEHALCCSTAYGAFPAQGLNPCPLQWQADSYPPHHQGSPTFVHGLFFWGVGGRFSTVFQSRGLDTTQWP